MDALKGITILIILGSLGAGVVSYVTGVDVETLCKTDGDTQQEICVENDEVLNMVSKGFMYIGILVAVVSFVMAVIAGFKY